MKQTLFAGVMLLSLIPLTGMAGDADAADIKRGKLLFLQCGACHAVTAGAPHGVGPNLNGIVGRKSGTVAGYSNYSAALRNAALTWNDATLDRWLQSPSTTVPGNNMAFIGLPKASDRQAVISYLKSLSPAAAK